MDTSHLQPLSSARRSLWLAAGMLLAVFATSTVAATAASADGLVPVKVKSLDKAWQKPGVSLGAYNGVIVRPVTVEFSRNWRPRDFGLHGLKSAEVERIRSRHADIAQDAFARGLGKGGLKVTTMPGPGVLELQAQVVDLYVNAPDEDAAFMRTYVRNAGQMRLLLTLRDSATGDVLFRSSDFRRSEETGRLEWANTVYNRSETQRVFDAWAGQLQRMLTQ